MTSTLQDRYGPLPHYSNVGVSSENGGHRRDRYSSSTMALSRDRLVQELRDVLAAGDHNPSQYLGRSFRIPGVATEGACRGLKDSAIQTLGRWRSDAERRVRPDRKTLAIN